MKDNNEYIEIAKIVIGVVSVFVLGICFLFAVAYCNS